MYTIFCSIIAQSLCIGLSIAPSDIALPPLQLQLKNITRRYFVNGSDEQDNKINWFRGDNDKLLTASNPDLAIGTLPQNRIGVVDVYDSAALEWLFPDNFYRLETKETRRCLTIMQCQRKPLGYCNPDSEKPSEFPHIAGSFVKLRRCEKIPPVSQQFIKYEHNCSRELLFNNNCDQECNNEIFLYDMGRCVGNTNLPTTDPTNSPVETKHPTPSPTIFKTTPGPTQSPTIFETTPGPSSSPTILKNTPGPSSNPTILKNTPEPVISKRPTNSPEVKKPNINVPFTTPAPTPSGFIDTYVAQLQYLWLLVLIIPLVFLFGYCTSKNS